MTVSFTQLLDVTLNEAQGAGLKFIGTATAAGQTVTTNDPEINKGGQSAASLRFVNRFLYIPSETGDDQLHSIKSISVAESTGVTTITTLDQFDSTSTSVTMYILFQKPAILRSIANTCLDEEYVTMTLPLSPVTDGDMQATGVTSWTGTNATPTKVTAAGNVLYGARGLRVANSGANGYAQNGPYSISRGRTFRAWAIARADVGTAILTVVDGSGNTLASVSSSEENWNLLSVDVTPGTSIEEVSFRLGGSGASDDTYWAGVGYGRSDDSVFYLPAWADEPQKVKDISVSQFRGATDTSNVHQAFSRSLRGLRNESDWHGEFELASVNGNYVELLRSNLGHEMPLFITGEIPASYFGTYSADSDVAYARMATLKERFKMKIGELYPKAFEGLEQKAREKLESRTLSRRTSDRETHPEIRGTFA